MRISKKGRVMQYLQTIASDSISFAGQQVDTEQARGDVSSPMSSGSKGSKYRGVSWNKTINKWHAQITINSRSRHLGLFLDEVEAAKAYDAAIVDNDLDRSKMNFPWAGGDVSSKNIYLNSSSNSSNSNSNASKAPLVEGREESSRAGLTFKSSGKSHYHDSSDSDVQSLSDYEHDSDTPTGKSTPAKRRRKSGPAEQIKGRKFPTQRKYKGVSWNKGVKKWKVNIMLNFRPKHIGYFHDALEAARAYDAAIVENDLDRSKMNFPLADDGENLSSKENRNSKNSNISYGSNCNSSSGYSKIYSHSSNSDSYSSNSNSITAKAPLVEGREESSRAGLTLRSSGKSHYHDSADSDVQSLSDYEHDSDTPTGKSTPAKRGRKRKGGGGGMGLAEEIEEEIIPPKSMYLGVSWNKTINKWHARITINSKSKHIGYFYDEVEAAKAYDAAIGDNDLDRSKMNFPPAGEGEDLSSKENLNSKTSNSDIRKLTPANITRKAGEGDGGLEGIGLVKQIKEEISLPKSMYRGVSWAKTVNKWHAQITINSRSRHIGFFLDEVEAAKAYDAAKIENNLDSSRLNFPPAGGDASSKKNRKSKSRSIGYSSNINKSGNSNSDSNSNAAKASFFIVREEISRAGLALRSSGKSHYRDSSDSDSRSDVQSLSDYEHDSDTQTRKSTSAKRRRKAGEGDGGLEGIGLVKQIKKEISLPKSMYRGVSWAKTVNKWHAQITINSRSRHIGFFLDEVEAAKAYDAAKIENNLDSSRLNFPPAGGDASSKKNRKSKSRNIGYSSSINKSGNSNSDSGNISNSNSNASKASLVVDREEISKTDLAPRSSGKSHYHDSADSNSRSDVQSLSDYKRDSDTPTGKSTPAKRRRKSKGGGRGMGLAKQIEEDIIPPKSMYLGVSWNKAINKWRARVSMNSRSRHLGFFFDEVEAAKAYDAAIVKNNLDRSKMNFPHAGGDVSSENIYSSSSSSSSRSRSSSSSSSSSSSISNSNSNSSNRDSTSNTAKASLVEDREESSRAGLTLRSSDKSHYHDSADSDVQSLSGYEHDSDNQTGKSTSSEKEEESRKEEENRKAYEVC